MTISAPTFVKASLSFSASSLEISAFTTAGAPSTNFLAWNQKQTCYTINKYIIKRACCDLSNTGEGGVGFY